MLYSKVHNKYFEITHDEGFNVPLKHTTFQKKDFIALKKGDVIHVTPEGMCFLGIYSGKDKFYLKRWLYLTDGQLYTNSDLPGVIRHIREEPLFKDVTKKFIRNKSIDSLLDQ